MLEKGKKSEQINEKMSIFQPFRTTTANGKETIAYVYIQCEIEHFKLTIEVSNVHDFTRQFKCECLQELIDLTFKINQLSEHDKNASIKILENILTIKESFNLGSINENIFLNINEDIITLTNNNFKYKLPLIEPSIDNQLETIKLLYKNLETFSQLQATTIDLLSTQITNKNQIISKLANAYYTKLNPFTKRLGSDSQIYKSKSIKDLFVNRKMIKLMDTTPENIIQMAKISENYPDVLFSNSKSNILWHKMVPNEDLVDAIKINSFEAEEEKTEPELSTESQPVKRKLQGILRREKRQNI
jgi:uncharacterized coiled-coil protein SlyX